MKLVYLNYKEPLKPVTDGYGYLGTLAQSEDGHEVQCHICGLMFKNLGSHAFNVHGMKGTEYRERFELNRTTPLCSDAVSNEYKARALNLWEAKSPEEKAAQVEIMKAAAKIAPKPSRDRRLELKNIQGRCPDQLLDKLQKLADKLSRTPTAKEYSKEYTGGFLFTLTRTFGSYNNALNILGLTKNKPGSKNPYNKGVSRYTDEALLQYLKDYYETYKLPPTFSDWKRHFFPDYHIYLKRFGSIKEARKLAGLPEHLSTRWRTKQPIDIV